MLVHTVDPSASIASPASALFADAVAVAPSSETGCGRSALTRSQVKVAIEPPGSSYSKDLSPTATAAARVVVLVVDKERRRTIGIAEPADISCPFHPVVPYDVLPIRPARFHELRQVPDRVVLGVGADGSVRLQRDQAGAGVAATEVRAAGESSAMFQLTTDFAQFRVVPSISVRACQVSVPRKICGGVSVGPCDPEHSVNQMPLVGNALCRSVCFDGSPE